MIKFNDLVANVEMEVRCEDVDYIEHTLEGIVVMDVYGTSYLTRIILFE